MHYKNVKRSNTSLSKQAGVTLIELLVVITIMMTMMSLVAPLAINTVDKAEAQTEYLSFCGLLRSMSVQAFANGSGIQIELTNNNLLAYIVPHPLGYIAQNTPQENKIIIERSYEYLNFSDTELKFNRNGMPNLMTINLTQRNKIRELDLIALLEN